MHFERLSKRHLPLVDAFWRGLGKMLIEFSAYQAKLVKKHAGVFYLTLDCYEHRVSFYESLGFQKNGIQPAQRLISMRLNLEKYLARLL